MNKNNVKLDVLKKIISRWIKHSPPKSRGKVDPLVRLVRAFLEYDAQMGRSEAAEQRLVTTMSDYNELRVTPAIELAAILGVRYPFAEARCSSLHRTLQSIFERENHMSLASLSEMCKPEVRSYLRSLSGINPFVEAVVSLECFDIAAAPSDLKLLLWLKNKDAVNEQCTVIELQQVLEKHIKAAQMPAFFHGSRKEIEDWSPKVWPLAAKIPSPVLAYPKDASSAAAKAPQNGDIAAVIVMDKPPAPEKHIEKVAAGHHQEKSKPKGASNPKAPKTAGKGK